MNDTDTPALDHARASSAMAPSHELKFIFPAARASSFVRWLQLRCRPDPEYPDGLVSSIYYDSTDWFCLSAKTNSDFLKTKIRWRWYSDPITGEPGEPAFLEVKSKFGANRNKKRIITNRTARWLSSTPLTDPRLMEACSILHQQGLLQPRAWFPAFQITYRRLRFIEPRTGDRLCLDYGITVPRAHPRLGLRMPPLPLTNGVIEFKTPLDDLPPGLHPLTAMGCRRASFSKYMACFNALRGIN